MKTIGPVTRRAQLAKRHRRKQLKAQEQIAKFCDVIDQARADGVPQWLLASKIDAFETAMRPHMSRNLLRGTFDGVRKRAFR